MRPASLGGTRVTRITLSPEPRRSRVGLLCTGHAITRLNHGETVCLFGGLVGSGLAQFVQFFTRSIALLRCVSQRRLDGARGAPTRGTPHTAGVVENARTVQEYLPGPRRASPLGPTSQDLGK